jgi:hypothetical protein
MYYLVRLIPPRPDFPFTMTEAEEKGMTAHAQYWREKMAEGIVLIAGPVGDPAGAWGLGVLHVANEAALTAFEDNDPVILANLGMRYEHMPMLSIMLPGGR